MLLSSNFTREYLVNSYLFLFVFCTTLPIFSFSQAPGCPGIDVSGVDVNGVYTDTIGCNATSLDLVATFLQTGETTSYDVSAVTYAPPYPFNTGTSIFQNIDDVWSSPISLPFDFCFFGTNVQN